MSTARKRRRVEANAGPTFAGGLGFSPSVGMYPVSNAQVQHSKAYTRPICRSVRVITVTDAPSWMLYCCSVIE